MTLKREEGLSKRFVQHLHAVICKTFNEALKAGLIYRNPATLVSAQRPATVSIRGGKRPVLKADDLCAPTDLFVHFRLAQKELDQGKREAP